MPDRNQPPRQGTSVAGGGRAALDTALAYYRAWTSHDFDKAMTYVAEDIICQAPAGRLEGAAAFRGFMGPFVQIVTSSSLIAAFGDDEKAVVMYDTGTVPGEGRSGRGVRHGARRQDHPHADHLRPGAVRRGAPRGRDGLTLQDAHAGNCLQPAPAPAARIRTARSVCRRLHSGVSGEQIFGGWGHAGGTGMPRGWPLGLTCGRAPD